MKLKFELRRIIQYHMKLLNLEFVTTKWEFNSFKPTLLKTVVKLIDIFLVQKQL